MRSHPRESGNRGHQLANGRRDSRSVDLYRWEKRHYTRSDRFHVRRDGRPAAATSRPPAWRLMPSLQRINRLAPNPSCKFVANSTTASAPAAARVNGEGQPRQTASGARL